MSSEHYLKLVFDNKIDFNRIEIFYRKYKSIFDPIIQNDKQKIILYKENETYIFCICLTRCLTEEELQKILPYLKTNFKEAMAKISQKCKNEKHFKEIWPEISQEVNKYFHKKWLDKKIKNGWQYGTLPDLMQKKHPLILPWENLPSQYKDIDEDLGIFFENLFKSMGLIIIQK